MEQFIEKAMPHTLFMEERKKLKITGVTNMDSFDEQNITAYTTQGDISIRGENLHIIKIDVDSGELLLEGTVYAIIYNDRQENQGGLFSKLFR